ncbi:MAG: hypothetical protein H6Q90_115 [Deltaproteobacteria bacterium]|nr:hypothetical protein [Deltaproteobacteria bacterium]
MRAGAVAAATLPLLRERRAQATASSTRPRFYLQIIPQGGMDAVYATDPKTVANVDPGIDIPFAPNAIVNGLGPAFGALARWTPRLAIVNAFRQNSANHLSGLANVMRCKSNPSRTTPSLLEILGARRQDEATGAVSIGAVMTSGYSPAYLGEPSETSFGNRPGLLEHLDTTDREDLVELAKTLRREAQPLTGSRASATEQVTADNLLASAELFARAAETPKFAPVGWDHPLEGHYHNGRDLQRALWLFENKLTRCVTMCFGNQDFDTHTWNQNQAPLIEYLGFTLDKLFTELERRTVGGKKLSEQTVVFVGSEIGRFPKLNSAHGKDHFPQCPHLFYGPGLATGATYGATGRNMASLPISLTTGKPDRGGHLLRVDDIGTTLLALDGANPELYGYGGERLHFLEA